MWLYFVFTPGMHTTTFHGGFEKGRGLQFLPLTALEPSEYRSSMGSNLGVCPFAGKNKNLSSAMISGCEAAWNEQQEACVEWYDCVNQMQDYSRVNIGSTVRLLGHSSIPLE